VILALSSPASAQSTFRRVRGASHMVHETAPGAVMAAIDDAAAAGRETEALARAAREARGGDAGPL
jgi:hypothetical protein